MKNFLILGFLFLVLVGCSMNRTAVVYPQGGSIDPGGDAYKHVLIRNESPFWTLFSIGTRNVVLGPGGEIVTESVRPLGWLSPSFGNYSFIAYAYRKYANGRLDEFVGQQEYGFYLDGYPHSFNGRVFGAVVMMCCFPVSTFGHPDRWKGNFFGIFPGEINFYRQ